MANFEDPNEEETIEYIVPDRELPCTIFGHIKSDFPIRSAEKKFEAYYFCVKCGEFLGTNDYSTNRGLRDDDFEF